MSSLLYTNNGPKCEPASPKWRTRIGYDESPATDEPLTPRETFVDATVADVRWLSAAQLLERRRMRMTRREG